jgi:hypothetical protein
MFGFLSFTLPSILQNLSYGQLKEAQLTKFSRQRHSKEMSHPVLSNCTRTGCTLILESSNSVLWPRIGEVVGIIGGFNRSVIMSRFSHDLRGKPRKLTSNLPLPELFQQS